MSGISTSCLDHDFIRSRLHEFIHNHYWQIRHSQSITPRTYAHHLVIATFCLLTPAGRLPGFKEGGLFSSFGTLLCFLLTGCSRHAFSSWCWVATLLIVYWNASQSVAVDLNVGFFPYSIANLAYSLSSHSGQHQSQLVTATFCFADARCLTVRPHLVPTNMVFCRFASCSQHASFWGCP